MIMISPRSVTIMAIAWIATACSSDGPSRQAKIDRVCEKLFAEEQATCGSDRDCLASAKANLDACKAMSVSMSSPTGKPVSNSQPSKQATADAAERKCAENDAESCATVGGAYLLGKGGKPRDETKGVELIKRGCELGSAFGCELYARAFEKGRGVPVDRAQFVHYMRKACEMGAGGACRGFAMTMADTDPKRIPLLEQACSKNDDIGCLGLGAAYLHGNQGAAKNRVKAKQYLTKACDLGATSACDKARSL